MGRIRRSTSVVSTCLLFLCFASCQLVTVHASYLDPPFFAFVGRFYADTPTLNNFINNFNPANPFVEWWNPGGTSVFQLSDVNVTAATDVQARFLNSSSSDCLLGARISSSTWTGSSTPKMVDIDVDNQFVSELIGLLITITLSDGSVVTGRWNPHPLRGQWLAAMCQLPNFHPKFGNNTRMRSGDWHSQLSLVTWQGAFACSPIMQKLRAMSPIALSIKMNVDDFNNDITTPDFAYGRLRGVIGPVIAGEPESYVGDRWLRSFNSYAQTSVPVACTLPSPIPFNAVPLRVLTTPAPEQRSLAVFDFANALPLAMPAGQPLFPVIAPALAADDRGTLRPLKCGSVHIDPQMFVQRSGIAVCELADDERADVASTALVLVAEDGATVLLGERSDGVFVYAEPRNHRLELGQTANITLRAWQYGKPLAAYQVRLALTESPMGPDVTRINNVPATALSFPKSLTTNSSGFAVLHLQAGNVSDPPGLPKVRSFLDSQIYFVTADATQGLDMPVVSAKVFNSHPEIEHPAWADVAPLLAVYSRLFPAMGSIVNISDAATVASNAASMLYTLHLDWSDPGYMPVTRDMSAAQMRLLINYLLSVHSANRQLRVPARAPLSVLPMLVKNTLSRVVSAPSDHTSFDNTQRTASSLFCPYLAFNEKRSQKM